MKEQTELVSKIQRTLHNSNTPAWLFYGFRDLDPIALRILQFGSRYHATRRWFYLVPARGKPVKLVHQIESCQLDHLPGRKEIYLEWSQLVSRLDTILHDVTSVAMQYSPNNTIPYISRVDAGTAELIRSCDTELVSSADLIQRFEAVLNPSELRQHRIAAHKLTAIVKAAFEETANRILVQGETSELFLQSFILDHFKKNGLETDFPPTVAVNENSSNPHYQPTKAKHAAIRQGDFLLIDLWAKTRHGNGVYADITWTAFLGPKVPSKIQEVFEVVRQARDRAVQFLRERMEAGTSIQGWEVDDAARAVIRQAGYEQFFIHRTGHNLGQHAHGNGVNFDNLETHDTRQVIEGVVCTIEPGIYLQDFGVRNEINVYISEQGPEITTAPQQNILVFKL